MSLFAKAKDALSSSNADKRLANECRQEVEKLRSQAYRMAHESVWMTNIAYVLGYDGVAFNQYTRQLQPINNAQAYFRTQRLNVNKILPSTQNRLARLCKNRPRYDVRPESTSDEDKSAARKALQTLTYLWDKLSIDQKRVVLMMWVQQCGHAYLHTGYDSNAGKKMMDPLTGKIYREGEVCVNVASAFEVFTEPQDKSFEDVLKNKLYHAKVRTVDQFKSIYGVTVKPENVWLLSLQYQNRINSINTRGPAQGGLEQQVENCAIEITKYIAPSDEYPDGLMIVSANGQLLDRKPLPIGEIPFSKFDDVVIGGKYFSESVITHARPMQDHYNNVVRRRAEWARKYIAGKYTAPRGGGLQQESMTDKSGEVVYYTPVPNAPDGGRPVPLDVPQLPQWAYNETSEMDAQFSEVFGISEVSKGQLPSASIPAIGMQLLTEQDDTRIGVMVEQHENAWALTGHHMLRYAEECWSNKRKIKITGPDLNYEIHDIEGKDIRGHTDVIVIRGSSLPGSKTLQRQEILNLYERGFYGAPNSPEAIQRVAQALEFALPSEVWKDQSLNQAVYQRTINAIEAGEEPEITEFDPHSYLLMRLNDYRKGDKYDKMDPTQKGLLLQTMEVCIQSVLKLSNQIPPSPEESMATNPPPEQMVLEEPTELPPGIPPGGV